MASKPSDLPDTPEKPLEELLIVGSGAMACLFGARLSAAGVSVTMCGHWREGLQALRQYGVRLIEGDGRDSVHAVNAVAAEELRRPFRFALVLVKSWQTGAAAQLLERCLAADGLAISLQNGLGNEELLEQALGAGRVAMGVTTTGASLSAPGCVRPAGSGAIILSAHPGLPPLRKMLVAAGFALDQTTATESLAWGKLVINAAINPISALLNLPNGEILRRPAARSLLAATALEAAAVAASQGILLPYPDPVLMVERITQNTATNLSSMLQDVQRGAPTEIDAINGAIVQTGKKNGVPTPINETLWQLIKAKVN